MELGTIVWIIAAVLLGLGLLGRSGKHEELVQKIFKWLGFAVVAGGLGFVGWTIIKVFI